MRPRAGEGPGTQVSGIPTEPRQADRSGTGEFGAIQSEGPGEVAELPESDEQPTTGRLAAVSEGRGYYRLAEKRRPIYRLERWIRRHIRQCFWMRWHNPEGRDRRLRSL